MSSHLSIARMQAPLEARVARRSVAATLRRWAAAARIHLAREGKAYGLRRVALHPRKAFIEVGQRLPRAHQIDKDVQSVEQRLVQEPEMADRLAVVELGPESRRNPPLRPDGSQSC